MTRNMQRAMAAIAVPAINSVNNSVRNFFASISLLLIAFFALPISASAQDDWEYPEPDPGMMFPATEFEYMGINFEVVSDYWDGLAVRTKPGVSYSETYFEAGSEVYGDIVIPDYVEFNGVQFKVIEISDYSFFGNTGLTSIILPQSIETFGMNVFTNCTNLTSVNFSGNYQITEIGKSTFYGCSSLTDVYLPQNIYELPYCTFYKCTSLNDQYLIGTMSNLSVIGENAFGQCSALEELDLPPYLTTIGKEAFYMCRNLKSISFPNFIDEIGSNAFAFCYSLQGITLPKQLKELPNGMIKSCISLGHLEFTYPVTTIPKEFASGCNKLYTIDIPESVTTIKSEAFSNTGAESFEIPEGVKVIESKAFDTNYQLKAISLPSTLTTLGSGAFANCKSIVEIYYPTSDPIVATADVFHTDVYKNAVLKVNEDAVDIAKMTVPWNTFDNYFVHQTAGIGTIIADDSATDQFTDNTPAEYFNLQGMSIRGDRNSLPAGIYIMRQGTKTQKIVVK